MHCPKTSTPLAHRTTYDNQPSGDKREKRDMLCTSQPDNRTNASSGRMQMQATTNDKKKHVAITGRLKDDQILVFFLLRIISVCCFSIQFQKEFRRNKMLGFKDNIVRYILGWDFFFHYFLLFLSFFVHADWHISFVRTVILVWRNDRIVGCFVNCISK